MAGEPKTTVKVEKVIRDAPINTQVDPDTLDIIDEGPSRGRSGRPPKKFTASDALVDSTEDQFADLLQDHTIKIHVDRVSPREFKGQTLSGLIEEYVPPTTQDEVEADIKMKFGGGRYRIRIMKHGRFIAARGFTVYGDPKIQEKQDDDDDDKLSFDPSDFAPPPYGMAPASHTDDISTLRMQIEKEKLKQQLDEVKGSGKKDVPDYKALLREQEDRLRKEYESKTEISNLRNDLDRRFESFLSTFKETLRSSEEKPKNDSEEKMKIIELENKLERVKMEVGSQIKETFSEMKNLIKEMAQPKVDHTPELLKSMMDAMAKIASGGDGKIGALMDAEKTRTQSLIDNMKIMNDANAKVSQSQTDKLLAFLTAQTQNRHDSIDNVARVVGSVRDIAENMGFAPGAGGGSGENEPQDMTTRIVGMIEKALPTLLASQKQAGRQLSDEEVKQIIIKQSEARAHKLAPIIAAEFIKKEREKAAASTAPSRPQGLPQPTPTKPQPQPQPVATGEALDGGEKKEATPQNPTPTETPVHDAESHTSQEPQAAPEDQGDKQKEEEEVFKDACDRVNECLRILLREVRIRPRKPDWIEAAFDELPDFILDRLVLVTNADELYEVVRPFAEPRLIEDLLEVLKKEDKNVAWLVTGLNELKMMYAEDNGSDGEDE